MDLTLLPPVLVHLCGLISTDSFARLSPAPPHARYKLAKGRKDSILVVTMSPVHTEWKMRFHNNPRQKRFLLQVAHPNVSHPIKCTLFYVEHAGFDPVQSVMH